MRTELPEYWYTKNINKTIRYWFSEEYNESEVKKWDYTYIGYNQEQYYNGLLGAWSPSSYRNDSIEITFEEFKYLVLGKAKPEPIYEIY